MGRCRLSDKKKPAVRTVLLWIGKAVGTVLFLAVIYLQLIMIPPREDHRGETGAEQPLLMASQAVSLTRADQVGELVTQFPVPVLGCQEGHGLTLIAGNSRDVAFEGGLGRSTTLVYQSASGHRITATSIYPARALTLLKGYEWHLSPADGPSVAGIPTVRMENGDTIRLHMQTDEGLYSIETTRVSDAELASLVQPFVLFIK